MERETSYPSLTSGGNGTTCAVCVQYVASEIAGVQRRSESPRTELGKAQLWPSAPSALQPCSILFGVDLQISSLKTEPSKGDMGNVGSALEFVNIRESFHQGDYISL